MLPANEAAETARLDQFPKGRELLLVGLHDEKRLLCAVVRGSLAVGRNRHGAARGSQQPP
jgi:hypothetical protein